MQKTYYPALDGLRGVAAVLVLIYHAFMTTEPQVVARGYLAVDFFFLLSGFVVASAYLGRDMSIVRFGQQRALRLYPTILLSVGVAAVCYGSEFPPGVYIAQALVWPLSRYDVVFPANGVLWSMLAEVVANVVFVLAFRTDTVRRSLIVAGVSLCAVVFGMYATHTINLGARASTLIYAFARVGLFFPLGIIAHQWLGARSLPALPLPLSVAALTAILSVPHVAHFDVLLDLVLVLSAMPLCFVFSIGTKVTSTGATICKWFALLSYPLYLVHMPLLHLLTAYQGHSVEATLGAIALALFFGAVATWCFDVPVRAFLAQRARRAGVLLAPR